jgi:signal transduction histidine kinase
MISLPRFSTMSVAVSYIVVSLTVLVLFATRVQYTGQEIFEDRLSARLQENAQSLGYVLQHHGADALTEMINTLVKVQPTGDEKFILLANPLLDRVAGNLPVWPRTMPSSPGTYTLDFELNGRSVHAVFVRTMLPGGYNLIVGRNTAKFQTVEMQYWRGLIGAACTLLVFGVMGGVLIRRKLLSEIHGISQTAAAIIAGDLSRRVPRRSKANELDKLAQTINHMLDQIERLIQSIRNVSNSIAHDLRTPLTEIRLRLEVLAVVRPPMDATFVLRLSEIDNGMRRSGFIAADVSKVAHDVVEFYQPIAELHGIALSFASTGKHILDCDPLLLAQAIGNLIDNALKYAREEVRVVVAATQPFDQTISVTVSDDGPGIPDAEKSKVIERFYRSDTSRSTPGVGLGLSLVAAVAKLHDGSLELTDAHPGLHATLFISCRIYTS